MTECERFYGKFRGVVLSNIDPMQEGRLLVQVSDVSCLAPSTWAMPCVPVGGFQSGMVALPTIGSGVWVEFEQGDPDHPIWTGSFWGSAAEMPALSRTVPPVVPSVTLQTPGQNGLVISDLPTPPGGVLLKYGSASISMNAMGISIQNGQGASITLMGRAVLINGDGLVVT